MAERGQQLCSSRYTCVAQHVIIVCIGHGARDFDSTVAYRFVKHSFKVLLHCVVDGPLQASCCLVLQSFNERRSFMGLISAASCLFDFLVHITSQPKKPKTSAQIP